MFYINGTKFLHSQNFDSRAVYHTFPAIFKSRIYINGTKFLHSQNFGSRAVYHTFPAIFKSRIYINGTKRLPLHLSAGMIP